MKICLVADPRYAFNQRWAEHFVNGGHEVHVISYSTGDIPGATPHQLGSYPSIWEREVTRLVWAFRGVGLRSPSTTKGVLSSVRGIAGQVKRSVRAGLYGLSCRSIISELRPDIVHGFGMTNHAVYAGSAGFKPLLAHAMGGDVLVDSGDDGAWRTLARYAASHAQIITSECQVVTDALVNVLGVPQDKIRTFPWGVDLEVFHPGYETYGKSLRKQLEIAEDAPVVLSQKIYAAKNNIDTILRATSYVFDKHPHTVFIFLRGVGPSVYEVELKQLARALGVESQVRFISEFLTPAEMAVLFNLADIVVSIPSSDAMAISLREAMSCGAIPIVSDLPDNREIVRDGKHGLILPETTPEALAETLNSCLADLPALKQRFKEINPPYIAREHNWQDTVRTMDNLYQELVSANPDIHPR
ncbi:MAG: glycosyltransferase family 4 protein [Chloroflexi bacterium]|nr:glycosyltransferase family 4 protein [Chloroflexota bacterium]